MALPSPPPSSLAALGVEASGGQWIGTAAGTELGVDLVGDALTIASTHSISEAVQSHPVRVAGVAGRGGRGGGRSEFGQPHGIPLLCHLPHPLEVVRLLLNFFVYTTTGEDLLDLKDASRAIVMMQRWSHVHKLLPNLYQACKTTPLTS